MYSTHSLHACAKNVWCQNLGAIGRWPYNKTKGFYAHKRADLLKQFKTNSFETKWGKSTIEKKKGKKKKKDAFSNRLITLFIE